MLVGVISGTGWMLATIYVNGDQAISSVATLFFKMNDGIATIDCLITILFYSITIIGIILAVSNCNKSEN